ncbi:MAG TPA: hypothetical protein VFM69_15310 [Pricia sp.]|nr:hypothetical protein [Pricia sp.]
MKTITTLIFVLFIGVTAQAQTAVENTNVDAVEMTIVTETSFKELPADTATEMARLYKRSNTRVKTELTFSTKANSPKMA